MCGILLAVLQRTWYSVTGRNPLRNTMRASQAPETRQEDHQPPHEDAAAIQMRVIFARLHASGLSHDVELDIIEELQRVGRNKTPPPPDGVIMEAMREHMTNLSLPSGSEPPAWLLEYHKKGALLNLQEVFKVRIVLDGQTFAPDGITRLPDNPHQPPARRGPSAAAPPAGVPTEQMRMVSLAERLRSRPPPGRFRPADFADDPAVHGSNVVNPAARSGSSSQAAVLANKVAMLQQMLQQLGGNADALGLGPAVDGVSGITGFMQGGPLTELVADALRSWSAGRGQPIPAGQAPTEQQIEDYREYMRLRASGIRRGDPRLARFAGPSPQQQQQQQSTAAGGQEAGQQALVPLSRQQRRALDRQQQKQAAKSGIHPCPRC